MKIVVVNTAASNGGSLSILIDFYEFIRANDKENEWIFLLNRPLIKETKYIKSLILEKPKRSWVHRLVWEIWSGGRYINSLEPDLVFSMQNTVSAGIVAPVILYLHQPLPFQKIKRFSFLKKKEFKLAIYQYIIANIIKRSIKKATKVIVQTQWMKNEIIKQTKKESVVVISPNTQYVNARVEKGYPSKNIFFYPASGAEYKNHQCIVKATKYLIKKGIRNFEVEFTLNGSYKKQLNITEDICENIKFIGHIPRELVLKKYSNTILVFPSYIETFGLPLLEAKNIGSIILASNCNFSKEILKDYPNKHFFSPFNEKELEMLMEQCIDGKFDYKRVEKDMSTFEENSWWQFLDLCNIY